MKKKLKIALTLLCALSMLLCLAACGDDEEDNSGTQNNGTPAENTGNVSGTDPDDPQTILDNAAAATLADLTDRYSGSPIAVIAGASVDGPTATTFDFSTMNMAMISGSPDMGVSGTLSADPDGGRYLLDASLSSSGISIGAQAYLDSEFIGVSVPFLTGGDTFYGLRPYGLTEQARGSIFDASTGSQFGIDISQLEELDQLIDSFKNAGGASVEDIFAALTDAGRQFADSASYEMSDSTVTVNGQAADGAIITVTYPAEAVAQYLEDMLRTMADSQLMSGILDYATVTGNGTTYADMEAQLEAAARELRETVTDISMEYAVSDGKLRTVSMSSEDGVSAAFTIDCYDADGGITVTLSGVDQNGSRFSSTVTSLVSGGAGYEHQLAFSSVTDGSSTELRVSSTYDSASGALTMDIGALENDAASAAFNISCTVTAGGSGFAIEDGLVSVPDPSGDVELLAFALSCEPLTRFTAPSSLVNVFELSESELMGLAQVISGVMMGA